MCSLVAEISSENITLQVCAVAQSFIQPNRYTPYEIALDWIMTTVSAPTLSSSLFLRELVCAF